MNRIIRAAVTFAAAAALAVGSAFAQGGQRGFIETKVWYVDENGKTGEALYWRIYMGDYDLKINQNIFGKGSVTVDARMNFQYLSSGYIEGNGHGSEGKINRLVDMRIRDGSGTTNIKPPDIDYVYDYGTKVALKDGRKGDFIIGVDDKQNVDVKRFQFTEYRKVKGSFGEEELKEFKDRMPIIGISYTKDGAARLAKEPVTSY